MSKSISRRDFIKGAAAGAVGIATMGVISGCTSNDAATSQETLGASAETIPVTTGSVGETTTEASQKLSGNTVYADTITWDETYDVIVAGFGIGGATAAVVSSDLGAKVLLVEKAPEAEAGGCSKYAGQLVLSTDNVEEFYTYLEAMAGQYGHVTDFDALRVYAEGAAENFDWLIKLGADPDAVSSSSMNMYEYPELPGVDSVKIWFVSGQANDSAYYRLLKNNVEVRSETLDVWYEAPAKHVIKDPDTKTILGLQVEKDGVLKNIRSKGGVILATGGYENSDEMIANYLDMPYAYTWAALYNTGDGVKLGIEAGADLWHMGVCAGYFWGFVPDDADPSATRCYRPGSVPWASSPACLGMMVGVDGTRWMNEAQAHRHGRWQVGGRWLTMKHPLPIHLIFDEEARLENLTNTVFKQWSENGEEELEKGWIIKADTLEELAEKLDMDAEKLVHAAQDINNSFDNGVNAQYERPHETLAPIRTAPFYAIKLGPTMYNTDGGPKRNAKAEVLDTSGDPIPHLYSCGDLGSIFAHMYNGGGNIGECTVFGRIAAREAVSCVDGELSGTYYGEGEGPTPSEDTLSGEDTGNYADGTYTAYGEGIGGSFPVTVTIAEGKITAVEIGENAETEGIGTNAIDAIPNQIIENQSYEVDGVAGATITGNAIKNAVKACLIEASR